MRSLGKLVLILIGILFLTAGLVSFYCVGEIAELRKAAQETPQEMSLADVLSKGSGTNAHVQVSGFAFGKPVVEEKDGQWKGVWLPLVPTTKRKPKDDATGPAILWASRVSNQEELAEFVQQTKLNVLCVAKISDTSKLRVRPSKTLRATQPDTDLAKATILAEPIVVLPDGTILEADVLFDEQITTVMGWGALAALIASGVCLWKGFRGLQGGSRRGEVKELGRPLPAPAAEDYAELGREQELSLHPFSWQLVFIRAGQRIGYLFACAVGIALFSFVAVQAFMAGKLVFLAFSVGLVVLLFYAGIYLTFMSVGALLQGISGFAVYPSGIRWQEGSKSHSALWQDIAEIYRTELRCFRAGELNNTFSTMTLKLFDGRTLKLSADTYAYFEAFVEQVGSTHAGWMAAVKRHEFAEHGYATFGPVIVHVDGVTVNGRFDEWEALEKYETENGHLNFFHAGAMFFNKTSIPLSSIPNSAALVSILHDMPNVLRGRRKVTV